VGLAFATAIDVIQASNPANSAGVSTCSLRVAGGFSTPRIGLAAMWPFFSAQEKARWTAVIAPACG
jgi:hypothetical protein